MKVQKKNGEFRKSNSKYVYRAIIVVLSVFTLLVCLITIVSTINSSGNLAFLENGFYIMRDDTKENIASNFDLVITKQIPVSTLAIGDAIVYSYGNSYACGKVSEMELTNNSNNVIIVENDGTNYQVNEEQVQGKIVANVNDLGYVVSFLRSPLGVVIYIIFLVCLFVLLRIIWVGRKKTEEPNTKMST